MRTHVDFSIHYGPSDAWGYLTGAVEYSTLPKVGEFVDISGNSQPLLEAGLPDRMRVLSTDWLIDEAGERYIVVGLEDVHVASKRDAEILAKTLTQQLGLIAEEFDEQSGRE